MLLAGEQMVVSPPALFGDLREENNGSRCNQRPTLRLADGANISLHFHGNYIFRRAHVAGKQNDHFKIHGRLSGKADSLLQKPDLLY
jgi:hypothetical protein